ncbi:MAG: hypothetical protein COA52_04120 [Hyphomicrobiales bacterium]|nr:MAG: hypothetical protein COA52_04120 [Hyphomicrobiales bacterium]
MFFSPSGLAVKSGLATKAGMQLAARLAVLFFISLSLSACGGSYIGAIEESLAGSIKFSSITVTTSGAQGRMESDTKRMAEVAPAVKAALEAQLKDRLKPSDSGAYPLKVTITYVDIASTATTGLGLYGGRMRGKAIVTSRDGATIMASADIQAAPKSGINKSSVNGIPVGLLFSAVRTAVVKPNGLPPLAAVFAAETRRALIGK